MEIRIVSDLHLEYASVHIPNDMQILRNGTEAGQVLVLAGDICEYNHLEVLKAFIQVQSERFYHVIYVPGNHEYYHNYFNDDNWRININLSKFLGPHRISFENTTRGTKI